jgi:hypothetical protein
MGEQIDPQSAVVNSIRWSRLPDLASSAVARHGFGDTDGSFGVTYPGDLDEYDRAVEGATIPDGFVEVYGCWGPPDGYGRGVRIWTPPAARLGGVLRFRRLGGSERGRDSTLNLEKRSPSRQVLCPTTVVFPVEREAMDVSRDLHFCMSGPCDKAPAET